MSGSSPESIAVAPTVVEAIIAHARAEAPRECCGLLVGTRDGIVECVPTANVDPSPFRYQVDPAAHVALQRRLRGSGRDIVGAYHSHPRSPAWPSPTDIADAHYPAFLYVIVSLAGEPDVRAFRIDGTAVSAVGLS